MACSLKTVSGRHIGTGSPIHLTLADGRIAAVEPAGGPAAIGGPDVWISPGFIDLQLNGFAGANFSHVAQSGTEDPYGPILVAAARSGTALFCPTIVTGSRERMAVDLRALARAIDTNPRLARVVAGIHVEGPYLSSEDGPRGAHPSEWVRDPDWEEFQRFQEAADGRIRLFTLAPERQGALPFIERLAESGVTVALGHTGADAATLQAAVRAGARMSTHLGNGAHAVLPRHPNYLWEQLACDELFASIIADGHHLPPSVVKSIARAKGPARLALVSDAISLGGLPPGVYNDGRHEVLPSGKIVLAGTPYLVGAGHLLDAGVANLVRFAGLSLAGACRSASAVPAALLGLQDRKGALRPAYDADLTLFRFPAGGALEIITTITAGELV